MLDNWDFSDAALNSTISQINRQKSARNLIVISINKRYSKGLFLDGRKKMQNTASLTTCDCKDFNFSGNVPRKVFSPCMHIYRLAMELGLVKAVYEDHRAREARLAHEIVLKKQAETARLQSIPHDSNAWGGWHASIHESGLQKNRQYRAYFILENPNEVKEGQDNCLIHDYRVALNRCECEDFINRHLPCKHIYAFALASKISLPLSKEAFIAAKNQGLEIVFRFEHL